MPPPYTWIFFLFQIDKHQFGAFYSISFGTISASLILPTDFFLRK